jgi:hypothetical protein
VLIKHIHSGFAALSSGDVFLEKRLALPFAPYPGLTINHGDLQWEIGAEPEIYFDLERQRFKVYVESDKTLYDAALHRQADPPSLESIVEGWIESGWERRPE